VIRRDVVIGLALCAISTLAACSGGSAPGPSTPGAAAASAPAPDDTAIADADRAAKAEADQAYELPDVRGVKWTGDLEGMMKRRVIRVLTTYSKVNYFVDQGRPRGLVYDAFRLFEDNLNEKLKSRHIKVHVVFIPVANDELIPALLDGRGDVVSAGTLLTAWRTAQVDATNPTRTNISSIIVTGPGVPPVATPMDLGGREVYLRKSDISAQGVDQFNAELAKAGKPPVKVRAAPEVLANEDILEMVNAGLVPMTMADDYIAEFWQKVFPNLVLNRGAAVRTNGQTGMLVRKNSPQLLAELNAFIARYPEGSATRNILFNQYLKSVKYARNATADRDRANFERTVELFRKYSGQYKLDFLLMAAQGYQESQLDQDAKSAVGAVGVMQVMPSTGKELGVGDIRQLEPNIHAGVKYVRFMMDRYFAGEKMTELDKGLFTFASYNAGPARIRDLRARAAQRGLNPNVWFNNVEVVAGEAIGRETVQYVANIYKYYLAYSLLTEQKAEREKAKAKPAA
jgi:membrane-bound lytic murein transglycosylase MltF